MPRVDIPGDWVDHSIHRLTEPDHDDAFERYPVGSMDRAMVNPARRSLWTCWIDCPAELVGECCETQTGFFAERSYHLVAEHVPHRSDIEGVALIATRTYRHAALGGIEALHIRYTVLDKSIDEIHAFLPDAGRDRVLVLVYSFPTQGGDGTADFERILGDIQLKPATQAEVESRWGGLPG